MIFPKFRSPRTVAALGLLTAVACHSDARYASFGVEALDAETAPWVFARSVRLGMFMERTVKNVQADVASAVIAASPVSCGSSTYDGTLGQFSAGSIVTLKLTDCETGELTDTVTVTLHNTPNAEPPSATAFSGHVSYQGTFDGKLTLQGAFELDYFSEGSSGPLAGDHDYASWTVENSNESSPMIVGQSAEHYVELSDVVLSYAESPTAVEPTESGSAAYVLTEPASLATLTMTTPVEFVGAPNAKPTIGVARIVDADGATASFDAEPLAGPSDTALRMTVDVDPDDGIVDFDKDIATDTIVFPEAAVNAGPHPGWL